MMNKLQEMRNAKGLSQSQLAKASGVSVRTLQNYEIERRQLSKAPAEIVLKLAKALDSTVEELIDNEE